MFTSLHPQDRRLRAVHAMDALALHLGNTSGSCYGETCDPTCEMCDHGVHACIQRSCFTIGPKQCHCPELSSETLVAVGAVRALFPRRRRT